MRRITGILAGIFLLLGIAVLLYNPLLTWMTQRSMAQQTTRFTQTIEQPTRTTQPQTDESQEELLEAMRQYNEDLYQNGQSGLTDAWSYEQAPFDFSQYGLDTDVFGVLKIPAMDQELPIYLGATKENMAKGVAILGQTSMPVGGENTNCVIVGHRGYGSTPFLREIETLQPGDTVSVTTLWGEKTYRVESTAIILPTDINAVLIQEGKEMLTLVTCHPYVEATHRYVVYCVADPQEEAEQTQVGEPPLSQQSTPAPDPGTSRSSSQERIRMENWLPFLAVPLVIVAVLLLVWPRRSSMRKRRKAEDEQDTP